jgi:DNA mismatch repair protein MutL
VSNIQILDIQTANSIAAGEVVERPASVVKELIENALDAGASVIHIEIRQGGISLIRVTDNGCGMDEIDAQLSFARHATSKIRSIDDLDQIRTMGFRGEALASIAAVAKVRLETRQLGADIGTLVEIAAGDLLTCRPAGCPEGTSITIENLFFNTPARFKFLKKDSSEAAAVADQLERIALARPDVSFRLVSQGAELLHTPGNNDLKSAIFAIFGREAAATSLEVLHEQAPVVVRGFIGTPEAARNSRTQQCFYVNGRLVRSRAVSAALDEAYATHLMKRKHPLAILMVDVPPPLVDVNVHPQKMEVRFWDEQAIFRAVYHAVQNTLQASGAIVSSTRQDGTLPRDDNQTVASSPQVVYRQPELTLDQAGPALVNENPATYGPAVTDVNTGDNFTTVGAEVAAPNQPPSQTTSQAPSLQPSTTTLTTTATTMVPPQPGQKSIYSLRSARLIGQIFTTYMVLEHGEDLLLVDQHAAHERILFEQLIARHRVRGPAAVQSLLIPQAMNVSARELAVLMAEQETLLQLGFEYEAFGQQSVLIRSLPDCGHMDLQPQAALRVALDTLLSDKLQSEEQISELYYSMACKAAIKAHDLLHPDEMNRLLLDLQNLDDPYHCPHGRPIIIRIGRYELEKQFKRIV